MLQQKGRRGCFFALLVTERPDVSILSDDFLEEVRALPYKNLAVEVLRKLLHDEIKVVHRRNIVRGREFSEMLQKTLNAYHNRAITTVEVIEELIRTAKHLSARRVKKLRRPLKAGDSCTSEI